MESDTKKCKLKNLIEKRKTWHGRWRQTRVCKTMRKSQGFVWDCWMRVVFIFLTKKSHKIHSIQESVKIYRLLNTNRQFISHEKSQLNTNGFCCLKKSHDCLDWIPQDLFTFYKSLDWIPLDFLIIKKSFKIPWIINSIHPPSHYQI